MTTEVKELFDTLMCNYDFPEEFAAGLAEFLYDEEYRLTKYGIWRAETDEEEPNPMFKHVVCSVCGGALTFYIDERMQWQRPTDEQIDNLKKLFCIEVIPEDTKDEGDTNEETCCY